VFEGQRITTERLGVDGVLRSLVADLAAIDGVESAVYSFDAADVSSSPSVEVELASTDFALWDAVVARVGESADDEALAAYPVRVDLASADLTGSIDTQYGADWFDDATFQVATDAASAFPGSRVGLRPSGPGMGEVWVTTPDPAVQLLDRLAEDPVLVGLVDAAAASSTNLVLAAAGLDLWGVPNAELRERGRAALSFDIPPYPVSFDAEADFTAPDEWVRVTLSGDAEASYFGVTWLSSSPLGEGIVWDAFVATVRDAAVASRASGGCLPFDLGYLWPGSHSSVSAYSGCGGAKNSGGSPDRPALLELRDALAAEGIIPEQQGFELV
jgi:hypothetical protein